jgi:hypothetical protein
MALSSSRQPSMRYRRQWRPIGIAVFLVIAIYWLFWSGSDSHTHIDPYHQTSDGRKPPPSPAANPGSSTSSKDGKKTKEMIIAKVKADDTKWLFTYFPEWKKTQYVVDDPKSYLKIPENKGRESMVYLTYVTFFIWRQYSKEGGRGECGKGKLKPGFSFC